MKISRELQSAADDSNVSEMTSDYFHDWLRFDSPVAKSVDMALSILKYTSNHAEFDFVEDYYKALTDTTFDKFFS